MNLTPEYLYKAVVTRIIDGDTLVALVDLGFRTWTDVKIRIRNLDTPERGEEGWAKAKQDLEEILFSVGQSIIIKTYKDKMSFDRWVADVWGKTDDKDNISIAEEMGSRGWEYKGYG